MKLNLSEIGK